MQLLLDRHALLWFIKPCGNASLSMTGAAEPPAQKSAWSF